MSLTDNERLRRELLLRSMFPMLSREVLARFAEILEPFSAQADTVLFPAGSAADYVFFVTRGRLALQAPGETDWTFGPRSVVGVIDAMIGRPRARACLVLEDAELLRLPVSEWLDLLEDDSTSARGTVRNFALTLHTRWQTWAKAVEHATAAPTQPPLQELSTLDKILALRRAPFLKPAGMQAIASLAGVCAEERFEAGEPLFALGNDSTELRVIVAGHVELSSANDFRLVQGEGELVGGPAALCGTLSSYAARALTPCVLLRIHEQDYYDQVEEHVRLTRGTLAYLVTELELLLRAQPPSAAPNFPLTRPAQRPSAPPS
jgi:CRP-like cAMP-binding protein